MNPTKASNMKSFAAILALLLVAVGAANAGDIIIKPKDSDGSVVGVAYQKRVTTIGRSKTLMTQLHR